MRIPTYLSYSSLTTLEKNSEEFFIKHLAETRAPKVPQERPASVGSAFDAYVKSKYGAVAPALTEVDDTPPGRTATAADWVAFADKHAGSFRMQMVSATPLLRLGDLGAARAVLERAAALVPFASGDASPWRLLVTTALKHPRVVGVHWFEHADQPAEGRFDGENSNYGTVTIDDRVYAELTAAMTRVNTAADTLHAAAGARA